MGQNLVSGRHETLRRNRQRCLVGQRGRRAGLRSSLRHLRFVGRMVMAADDIFAGPPAYSGIPPATALPRKCTRAGGDGSGLAGRDCEDGAVKGDGAFVGCVKSALPTQTHRVIVGPRGLQSCESLRGFGVWLASPLDPTYGKPSLVERVERGHS